MNTLKYTWQNFSLKNWMFEKRKLANPFLILTRILILPFMYLAILFLMITLVIWGNSWHQALQVWEDYRVF